MKGARERVWPRPAREVQSKGARSLRVPNGRGDAGQAGGEEDVAGKRRTPEWLARLVVSEMVIDKNCFVER